LRKTTKNALNQPIMEFELTNKEGCLIIFLKGKLTTDNDAIEVKESLNEYLDDLDENQKPNIIIDLKDMEFINSSGINFLVYALNEARIKGGDCSLTGISDRFANILLITKLESIFSVNPDLESALLDFKK